MLGNAGVVKIVRTGSAVQTIKEGDICLVFCNGIKPAAYICLNDGYQPSNDLLRTLLQHCGQQLAAYKCPRWVEFVDELPKTATGKIQRFKLCQTTI